VIGPDFAKLTAGDLVVVGGVLVVVCIGGMVGLARVLAGLHAAGLG